MKKLIPAFAVLLFVFNYLICELFYKNDIEKWWELRTNISAIVVMLCFYSVKIEKTPVTNLIANLGIGFSVSDVIDRWVFDVNQFTKSDVLMIIITIGFSSYNYVRQRR